MAISRREFIKLSAVAGAGALLTPLLLACSTEEAAAGGKGRGRSGRRERILSPVPGKYG